MKKDNKMNGQTKCAILREIRRKVCALNGLENMERDCMYKGDDCKGTCPYCDAQLERINAQLEEKHQQGETIYFDGLKELYQIWTEGIRYKLDTPSA